MPLKFSLGKQVMLATLVLFVVSCSEDNRGADNSEAEELKDTRQRLDVVENKVAEIEHWNDVANAAAESLKNSAAESEEDRVKRLKEGQATTERNTKMMCDALPGQC